MTFRLESAANVMVIVACTAFAAHYTSDFFKPPDRSSRSTPAYKAGDSITDTADLGLNHARMTMLLVTRSGCHFCSASMPFLSATG
jgi:hypothetical protein